MRFYRLSLSGAFSSFRLLVHVLERGMRGVGLPAPVAKRH